MDRVDVFFEPARAFLVQIGAYLPRLGVAVLIVILGWLLAKAVRFAVVRALRAINFNVLTRRAGIDGFLEQGGVEGDTGDLLGWIAYWIVIVLALVIAFNGLGLEYITELLGRGLAFLPRVAPAVVVLATAAPAQWLTGRGARGRSSASRRSAWLFESVRRWWEALRELLRDGRPTASSSV
mgnify:CR=1 FL=1